MSNFEDTIKAYLDKRAAEDPLFATSYAKEKKSIKECCSYIMGEAKKQAVAGAAVINDDVVFGWAVHYYDEDNIKVNKVNGSVKTSNKPAKEETHKPTKRDRENARAAALKRLEEEAYNKLRIHRKRAAQPAEANNQLSMF